MTDNPNSKDVILEMFISPDRWQYAIAKGYDKGIRKDQLTKLCNEEHRKWVYRLMRDGVYRISPPHTAKIPKDTPGEFRTVYVNEPMDRVILSIANDLLFELMPEMIHPRCKSYLKGVGCGKVVKEVSARMVSSGGGVIGWKSDLSKYFDSVPLRFIDAVFDKVEDKWGRSRLIDVIRAYYHSNLYFNEENVLCEGFQSLKQGCAVAAFLADAMLWHIDDELSRMDGYYIRYSDDMLFIGAEADKAMGVLSERLSEMEMRLNPKKVEALTNERWFKFLGYSIKGQSITLSPTRIKKFQKEIESRTIGDRDITYRRALNKVNRFLYGKSGAFSWATQILPVCNVSEDLDTLNAFVMDCLRAVSTGKRKVGGLGYVATQEVGCISRGTGRNVTANRAKTGKELEGYLSISCMRNAMLYSRDLYATLVATL